MGDSDADHPYSPVRAYEAMRWEKTDTCNWLRSNPFTLEFQDDNTTKKNEEKNGANWSLSNVGFDSLIPKFKGFLKNHLK